MKEMVGGCCVCSDERGWTENPLVYCDGQGCNVAVHQACYGIVRVPTGPWFCRKCESQERSVRMRCELCPQKDGALKQTDTAGWCHVVCALFIPEAWFANVQTMEPIVLKNVPPERFNRVCYICEENGRESRSSAGACMQCNRNGCKYNFHVTCAQAEGLLCEEAGNYGDNVKYCGYCINHSKKMRRDSNIKIIPPFQPIPNDSSSTPDSTPEKNNLLPLNPKDKDRPKVTADKVMKTIKLTPHEPMSDSSSASSPVDIVKLPDSESRDISSKDSSASINAKLDGAQTLVNLASSSVLNSAEPTKSVNCAMNVNSVPLFSTVTSTSPNISSSSPGSMFSAADGISGGPTVVGSSGSLDRDEGPAIAKRQRRISEEMAEKKKPRKTKAALAMNSKHKSIQDMLNNSNYPEGLKRNTGSYINHNSNVFGGSPFFQNPMSVSGLSAIDRQGSISPISSGAASCDLNSSGNAGSTDGLIGPPKSFPSQSAHSPHSENRSSPGFPASMEELLERQWEHGSQFLMEQGQHFDIASLLSCLHQLKAENHQLDDYIQTLISRRDHLLAVNARLSVPFTQGSNTLVGKLCDSELSRSTPKTGNPHSNSASPLTDGIQKLCSSPNNANSPSLQHRTGASTLVNTSHISTQTPSAQSRSSNLSSEVLNSSPSVSSSLFNSPHGQASPSPIPYAMGHVTIPLNLSHMTSVALPSNTAGNLLYTSQTSRTPDSNKKDKT